MKKKKEEVYMDIIVIVKKVNIAKKIVTTRVLCFQTIYILVPGNI